MCQEAVWASSDQVNRWQFGPLLCSLHCLLPRIENLAAAARRGIGSPHGIFSRSEDIGDAHGPWRRFVSPPNVVPKFEAGLGVQSRVVVPTCVSVLGRSSLLPPRRSCLLSLGRLCRCPSLALKHTLANVCLPSPSDTRAHPLSSSPSRPRTRSYFSAPAPLHALVSHPTRSAIIDGKGVTSSPCFIPSA